MRLVRLEEDAVLLDVVVLDLATTMLPLLLVILKQQKISSLLEFRIYRHWTISRFSLYFDNRIGIFSLSFYFFLEKQNLIISLSRDISGWCANANVARIATSCARFRSEWRRRHARLGQP